MSAIAKTFIAGAVLSVALAASSAIPASAAGSGVKAGFLKCDVAGNLSFIFGSSRDIKCVYNPGNNQAEQNYDGSIKTFGVDIGYQKSGVMVWGEIAPTNNLGAGALAGDYVGATATVAVGLGVGANALVGGYKDSIALQPFSVQGMEGLNVAGGIGALTLKAAP